MNSVYGSNLYNKEGKTLEMLNAELQSYKIIHDANEVQRVKKEIQKLNEKISERGKVHGKIREYKPITKTSNSDTIPILDKHLKRLRDINGGNNTEYNKLKDELCSNLFPININCYNETDNPKFKLYPPYGFIVSNYTTEKQIILKPYVDKIKIEIGIEADKFIKKFKPDYTKCIFETYILISLGDKNDTKDDISIFDDKNIISSRIQNNIEIFKNNINKFYDDIDNNKIGDNKTCNDLFKKIFPNKEDFLESILKYVSEKYPDNTGGRRRRRTRKIQRGRGKKTHCRGSRGKNAVLRKNNKNVILNMRLY